MGKTIWLDYQNNKLIMTTEVVTILNLKLKRGGKTTSSIAILYN